MKSNEMFFCSLKERQKGFKVNVLFQNKKETGEGQNLNGWRNMICKKFLSNSIV